MDLTTPKSLEFIFGPESTGDTPEERARTSVRRWCRSQDHLALVEGSRDQSKALHLSSAEALEIFGLETLDEALEKRTAVIILNHSEPAASLRRVRIRLKMTREQLARKAGLEVRQIEDSESESTRTPMSTLIAICQVLELDPKRISWKRFE